MSDNRIAQPEIKVTPDMLEAGLEKFLGCDRDRYLDDEIVIEIYLAMEAARMASAPEARRQMKEGDRFTAHLPYPPYELVTFVWLDKVPKIHTYDEQVDGPLTEGQSLPRHPFPPSGPTQQECPQIVLTRGA